MKIVILLFACMALPNLTSAMISWLPSPSTSDGSTCDSNFNIPDHGSQIFIHVDDDLYLSGFLLRHTGNANPYGCGDYGYVLVHTENGLFGANLDPHDRTNRGPTKIVDDINTAGTFLCYITRPRDTSYLAEVIHSGMSGHINYVTFIGPIGTPIKEGPLVHAASEHDLGTWSMFDLLSSGPSGFSTRIGQIIRE